MHVYNDGSVHLNHGGTEMGQGLYTKVAQVVAEEFQIDIDRVKASPPPPPARCPTPRPRRPPPVPISTAWPRRTRRARSRQRLIDFAVREPMTCRRTRSCSCPAGCVSATRRSPSPRSGESARPIWQPHPAFGGRFLQDAEDPLGSRQGARVTPVLLLLPMAPPVRGFHRHADRRIHGRARRYPARRRRAP